MMVEKLDDHINGDMSVRAQMERITDKRNRDATVKQKKAIEMKKRYKELLDSSISKQSTESTVQDSSNLDEGEESSSKVSSSDSSANMHTRKA
jgi:hypothetical protein